MKQQEISNVAIILMNFVIAYIETGNPDGTINCVVLLMWTLEQSKGHFVFLKSNKQILKVEQPINWSAYNREIHISSHPLNPSKAIAYKPSHCYGQEVQRRIKDIHSTRNRKLTRYQVSPKPKETETARWNNATFACRKRNNPQLITDEV